MRVALVIAAALSVGLGSCGYSLVVPGPAPDGISNVHVARADVGDGDPLLADALTRELRREIRRGGRFAVSPSSGEADAVLSVTVTTHRARAIAFDAFDDVLDYETTLAADAALTPRGGGDAAWSKQGIAASRGHAAVAGAVVTSSSAFQADERFERDDLAALDGVQLGRERRAAARARLITDLAKAIYGQMSEGL